MMKLLIFKQPKPQYEPLRLIPAQVEAARYLFAHNGFGAVLMAYDLAEIYRAKLIKCERRVNELEVENCFLKMQEVASDD